MCWLSLLQHFRSCMRMFCKLCDWLPPDPPDHDSARCEALKSKRMQKHPRDKAEAESSMVPFTPRHVATHRQPTHSAPQPVVRSAAAASREVTGISKSSLDLLQQGTVLGQQSYEHRRPACAKHVSLRARYTEDPLTCPIRAGRPELFSRVGRQICQRAEPQRVQCSSANACRPQVRTRASQARVAFIQESDQHAINARQNVADHQRAGSTFVVSLLLFRE